MSPDRYVYLVEKIINSRLEPIAVLTGIDPNNDNRLSRIQNQVIAKLRLAKVLDDELALVTKLKLNEVYRRGIGSCEHWHY